MRFLTRWLLLSLTVLALPYILQGIHVPDFLTAVIAAAVLGIINAFIRPILLFLSIPLRLLTLGLFTLILNALLLMLVTVLVPEFIIDTFWWALAGSLILAVAGSLINRVTEPAR